MNAKDLQIQTIQWEPYYSEIAMPYVSFARGLVDLLRNRSLTISVAESCTGGLLAKSVTSIPGSSQVFDCGVVCYSNLAKSNVVGVHREVIEGSGAVSRRVAQELAIGMLKISCASIGIGITGIAGPVGDFKSFEKDDGTKQKPVGLVHIAIIGDPELGLSINWHHEYYLTGSRTVIQKKAAEAAMFNLIQCVEGESMK